MTSAPAASVKKPSKPEHHWVKAARFIASAPSAKALPPPVNVEVAFAGRSNVGKSTLLNALMGRKGLARTSSTPGCTREVVLFEVRAADDALMTFADLPGYGYAKRSKTERRAWGELMEDYLLARPSISAVVLLVDARRGLEDDDRDCLELVTSRPRVSRRPIETLVVATKLDKLGAAQRKPTLADVSQRAGRRILGFAESDRDSHEALFRAVRKAASLEVGGGTADHRGG